MPHALDGARSKIERAIQHFEQLNGVIEQLFINERDQAAALPPAYEYKSDNQELIVKRPQSTPLDPVLPLLVGDCVHNARSALDHLVFQLAVLNCASSEAATKTSFPVCLTAAEFKNAIKTKIAPFISSSALADIEKFQPYAAGNAGADDIIWVLSQLDIIDKHRLLIVTQCKVRPVAFTVTVPSGEKFSTGISSGPWRSSEAGTELIRFDLSKAIRHSGKMEVKIDTAMTIQIEKTGLICDGMLVQAVVSDCIQLTTNIVDTFGKKFFAE